MSTRKKLFAVATLSGRYKLTASLVLAPDPTAAIKLAIGGGKHRSYRNHECQVVEATPEFLETLPSRNPNHETRIT